MSKLFGTFPYVINLRNTRSARDFSGLVRQKTLYPHFSIDRETDYTALQYIVSNNFGSAKIFCGRLGYIQIYPSQDCDHGNLRYFIAIF